MPGLIELQSGVTQFLPNLPGQWRGVPAAAILQSALGCPVYLLNDARLAAYGEMTFGLGRDCPDLLFFTLGTGVGGGVVLNGKLRLGPLGAAGEMGHQTLIADGPLCGCGNYGCVEAVASAPALTAEGVRLALAGQAPKLLELVEGNTGRITPREMAQAGDAAVIGAIERAGRYLGIAAANVITTLHCRTVVFGGGMSALGSLLFDAIRSEIGRRLRMMPSDDIRIERSALGDKAGIYGGIALARDGGLGARTI
jgi:glucokinase